MINNNDINSENFKTIQNIAMNEAASAVQTLLNAATSISVQNIEVCKASELDYDLFKPAMLIRSSMKDGLSGNILLIFSQSDLELMLNQLMGLTPDISEEFKFDELNISAVSEIVNQMLDSYSAVLSSVNGSAVSSSQPEVFADEALQSVPGLVDILEDDDICAITYLIAIDEVTNGRFIMVLPESIVSVMSKWDPDVKTTAPDTDDIPAENFPLSDNIPASLVQEDSHNSSYINSVAPAHTTVTPAAVSHEQSSYTSFQNTLSQEELNNLQLLMNIPLDLSIEIGSTQKKVDEILSFSHGTVVELDNPADAPVNVTVNGHLIAKGDVVVVDDHFAVRVTEVLKSNLINTLNIEKSK